MSSVIKILKNKEDYIGSDGRSEESILCAEKELGISFACDYREYLTKIGLACYDGHELTGITDLERLDVVSVTQKNRKDFMENMTWCYVIEEAYIDDIVIWQSSDGTVYETTPNSEPRKISDSFAEYISK